MTLFKRVRIIKRECLSPAQWTAQDEIKINVDATLGWKFEAESPETYNVHLKT